ncbi:hypothetical protein BGW36DRAFT_423314 [Talaromyces proteolyticus]|uniref:Uncharacterized protein n=1 Tax=Talaromyces proteolyticus TaxID=1131652 RepID=A0AAD4KY95_9EURO|nr:uncharacterized protein BGW36DRAFT_423314 [Talaromyces proteolyticus]KAH8703766.1 hypothetical protein BGW36DRAFT_423314 [Talaromyces proteolyticus]
MAGEKKNSDILNITPAVDGASDPSTCKRTVHPDKMVFFDNSGERHEIYLPKETYQRAVDLSQAKNWDELSKFPTYAGQGYKE